MVCTWLHANQKWKALHVMSRLAEAERAKVRCPVPRRTPCPWAAGSSARCTSPAQGQSMAQLRLWPFPETCCPAGSWTQAEITFPFSAPESALEGCAGCKDQWIILLQTSLGICLGVHWLWILGEDYGIPLMISYFTCFMYALSVYEFGWKHMRTITLVLVFFLQFTIFKGLANSLSYKLPSQAIVRLSICCLFFGIHQTLN